MTIESLDEYDRDLIRRALEACSHGPFFDEWEFQTLFGLTRPQFGEAAHRWTEEGEVDAEVEVAIRNAIVNLVGYPHGLDEVLEVRFEVDRGRLEDLLRRLTGS